MQSCTFGSFHMALELKMCIMIIQMSRNDDTKMEQKWAARRENINIFRHQKKGEWGQKNIMIKYYITHFLEEYIHVNLYTISSILNIHKYAIQMDNTCLWIWHIKKILPNMCFIRILSYYYFIKYFDNKRLN